MQEEFIKTGKVSFTYKYLPIYPSGESVWVAEAAECANQQGKFWAFHDRLFQIWRGADAGMYTKPALKLHAEQVGLNQLAFAQCIDGDKTASIVQADMGDAARRGIHQTPTFLLNGRPLELQSIDYSWFKQVLEAWQP